MYFYYRMATAQDQMEAKYREMFADLPKWSIEEERKARREFRHPLEVRLRLNETAYNNKISHRAGRGVFEEVFVNPSVQIRKKGQVVVSHMELGYADYGVNVLDQVNKIRTVKKNSIMKRANLVAYLELINEENYVIVEKMVDNCPMCYKAVVPGCATFNTAQYFYEYQCGCGVILYHIPVMAGRD